MISHFPLELHLNNELPRKGSLIVSRLLGFPSIISKYQRLLNNKCHFVEVAFTDIDFFQICVDY